MCSPPNSTLDPIEIRRRNFIAKDRFPYTTPTGAVYDTGDYDAALDCVLALSGYADRRREQAERRARDDRHLLGIGVAVYVEVTAGAGPTEFADVEIDAEGKATVKVGTFSHGQGHKTTYSQIASDALGIPFADITIIDGDTAKVARGVGTYSSRSVQVGGTAIHVACGQVVEKAKLLAADILEAAAVDIVHDGDGFSVAGVPSQRVTWAQAAARRTRCGNARKTMACAPVCSSRSIGSGPTRRSPSARMSRSSRSIATPVR